MSRETSRWEHFHHGADIGIRGVGPTPEAAFEEAAMAVTAVVTALELVKPVEEVSVELEGAALEELFFRWIDALVFEMSTRRMLFSRFEVRFEGHRLLARLWGEAIDRARHEPAVEVKGPTLTELRVVHDAAEWTVQCVVDV